MHICFAAIDYHGQGAGGGIASYASALGGEFVRRGHQVTVLVRGKGRQMIDEHGVRVVQAPLGNLHWYLYRLRAPSLAVLPVREVEWSWALRRAVERLHAAEPIDILEATETGALFLSDSRRRLPPLIVRLHGDGYVFAKYSGQKIPLGMRMNRQLTNCVLRRAAGVTAPSRFQAREFTRMLNWREECVHVTPNPISPWFLNRALTRNPDDVDQSTGTILYAGRLEYCKGVIPLLRSVPFVASAVPSIRYVIAGGRHTSISEEQLNRVLGEDNLCDHVEILGHVPWAQLLDLYFQAAVFVMPSLYESFGISIVEAMACGLPVVATTAGGIPEVVEDGVTGILVPPGDPRALGEAIIRLLRDPELRWRMGQAGRERVLAMFTATRVADQTLAVYHQCIGVPAPCES